MLDETQAKVDGLKLVARSKVAMLGTVGKGGFPEIRAMLKTGNDGLKTVWFSTNTSSRKVRQIQDDPRACVYFADNAHFKGLRLIGNAEILLDPASKRELWQPWFEQYYKGPEDPDYAMIRFTMDYGYYYSRFQNVELRP
jgi:pyridoxamine 5'-phosphate oxidase